MNATPRPAALSAACALFAACALLSGCGMSMSSLNPFGGDNTGRPYVPENATLYSCNNGPTFYLRTLKEGDLWVIYPDRQIRLDKQGGERRYTNGVATLEFDANNVASLSDGPQISYTNCTAKTGK